MQTNARNGLAEAASSGTNNNPQGQSASSQPVPPQEKLKTKRSEAAIPADDKSQLLIVLIPGVLARHEAEITRVPGRKAKDQSKFGQIFMLKTWRWPNRPVTALRQGGTASRDSSDMIGGPQRRSKGRGFMMVVERISTH